MKDKPVKRTPTTNFGAIFLHHARRQVKEAGIKVGRLYTYRFKRNGANIWYNVFESGQAYPVWAGIASNANIAKANYLYTLTEHTEETPEQVIDSVPEHMRNVQDYRDDKESV